jgi:hypothetical protein
MEAIGILFEENKDFLAATRIGFPLSWSQSGDF